MIVDPEPTCRFISAEGNVTRALFFYECPCGTINEVDSSHHPFDLLYCWWCSKYSFKDHVSAVDDTLRLLSDSGIFIAAGQPRKNVRDTINSMKVAPYRRGRKKP